MFKVCDCEALEAYLTTHAAVLVLYGGAGCGVCQTVKPPLEALLQRDFPSMRSVYVDCQGEGLTLCAQRGVLSLPVVEIYFAGQLGQSWVRTFSLREIGQAIARPYSLLLGQQDEQTRG